MSSAIRNYQLRVAGDPEWVSRRSRDIRAHVESTIVLLIRHAHVDAIGRTLCGRQLGITLSGMGVLQAEELARAITASSSLAAIYSGPLERARATADAIARCQRVTTRVCDELDEIDFGSWTGKTFDALADDPAWHTFNRTRATSIIPGGESPVDVQQRIVAAVARLAAQHRGHTIALVSHCDVVRSALLQYLSLSLDRYHEIEIAPASVSAIEMRADGSVRVAFVNRAADALAQ